MRRARLNLQSRRATTASGASIPPRLHACMPGARGELGRMKTQYSIELIRMSANGLTEEGVLARESDLDTAKALYKFCAKQFPHRVIVLADRARVLARSDCP